MTTSVFDNLDDIIDKYIEAEAVTYYGKPNETISIEKYITEHEEDKDRAESRALILKLIGELFPEKVIIPEKKLEPDDTQIESVYNDPFDSYPKLTNEQFFRKMQLNRQKRNDIINARKIHNWYRLYKDDIDELFYNGLATFEDNGIDFSNNIREMYDHFVEEQYYLNV
jgi:hypothetical protein